VHNRTIELTEVEQLVIRLALTKAALTWRLETAETARDKKRRNELAEASDALYVRFVSLMADNLPKAIDESVLRAIRESEGPPYPLNDD